MSTIKIRRGTKSQLDGITLASGELGFTTDTKEVFCGDATTNHLIGGVTVDTFANRPTAGQSGRIFHATDTDDTYIDDGTVWNLTGYTDLSDMSGDLDDISDGTTYGRVLNTHLSTNRVNQLHDGTNNVTASQARTHIDDATLHRIINDSGTSTTELWSASKIGDEIDDKLQGISWQEPVIDRIDFDTAEPAAPTLGDRYINTVATASSSETAQAIAINTIVEWNSVDWDEFVPEEGYAVYVEDEDKQYNFNGSSWVTFGSTTSHANLSGLQGGTSAEYYHLTNTQHTDLTDAGDSSLHYHSSDRNLANSTGNITTSQVTDLDEFVEDTASTMITGGTHSGGISVTYNDNAGGNGTLDIDMANDGHTHDTRYFTETEMGATAGATTSGAYLVGVYAAELDNASSSDLQGVLDELDQAISDTVTGGYTDEDAQDAIGTILVDTADIDFTYNDTTPSISALILQVDGGSFV